MPPRLTIWIWSLGPRGQRDKANSHDCLLTSICMLQLICHPTQQIKCRIFFLQGLAIVCKIPIRKVVLNAASIWKLSCCVHDVLWLTEYLFSEVTLVNCILPLQLWWAYDGEGVERTTWNSGCLGSWLPRKRRGAAECPPKPPVNKRGFFSVLIQVVFLIYSLGLLWYPIRTIYPQWHFVPNRATLSRRGYKTIHKHRVN